VSDTPNEPRRQHRGAPLGDVVLAVDIGGTSFAAGLVTLQGELIDREQVAVNHDLQADALFGTLRDLLDAQMERARGHHHMCPR